jgi:hypothetical protein
MVSKIDNITNIPSVETSAIRTRYSEAELTALVDRYLDNLHVDERTSVSGELSDFFEMVQTIVVSKQNYDGTPSDKRILILEDDPPEAINTEAIAFFMKARVPGRFDQGPAGTGRVREPTPHIRSITKHPEAPSQKLITAGRFYDNWITFNVYARTHKVALSRLLWFERTMDIYNWYFRIHGFRVIEEGVGDRERLKLAKLDDLVVTRYPITYMVRTDDTFHYNSQELKRVNINLELSNN